MQKLPNLAAVIKREQDALATETKIAQCPPLVAVNQLEEVTRVPTALRWNNKTSVEALPQATGGAFVVDCPSLNSTALWVSTSNNYYRREYLTYLKVIYGLDIDAIQKPYDVDHLCNRSRAEAYGLQFIRLALIGSGPNRSHGAAYEKDITTNEALRRSSGMKLMDAISSMKYWGYLSPLRDDPRESEIAAYVAFAASKLGLDPVEERKSILYLREKASKPWAKKK